MRDGSAAGSVRAPGAGCRSRPKASAVYVDHCHGAGRVRGVLCFNCNSAIGKLGDDPDAVRRAAAYLEGTSWKRTLVVRGVCRPPS
ncbi:endonuclease domain-containing protein [Streptomyces fungicidicus]|uniref:endonuclease domain-containing protein n=1 Tax=Streptomyces fungicidicus TaxID=68203 RepID=UPI00382BE4E0